MRVRGSVQYRVRGGELCIYAYHVDAGRVSCESAPKPPYAFILVGDASRARRAGFHVYASDLRDALKNRPVAVAEADEPGGIKRLRDRVVGYERSFEADIPYVRRLMIDGDLIASYDAGAVVYVDIEVDDSRGFPRPGDELLSIAYSVGGGETRFLYRGDYESGVEIVRAFLEDTVERGATVFAAWNAGFDWLYLYAYLRGAGADRETLSLFELFEVVDLYDAYKQTVKGLSSYTLLEVARHENLPSVDVKARVKRVSEMDRRELEAYNIGDVELIKQIDSRYGFTSVALRVAEYVNLTVSQAFYAEGETGRRFNPDKRQRFEYRVRATRIGDSLLIPRARELGYVLPNVPRRRKKGYPGAYVHTPKPGFYRRVGVYDFASMYPSIIVNERIDVFEFRGEVLPRVEEKLLRKRAAYKRLYKATGDAEFDVMQRALKIIANALYGLFGTEGSRYLDEGKASLVTGKGRSLILGVLRRAEEEWGEGVAVYGDTDSVFLDLTRIELEPERVADVINSWIAPYRVKLEAVGKLLIQAKKRYILVTEAGKWIVKGIELRRGDWDAFTKMVVESVARMVFDGKPYAEIREWLARVRAALYRGEYDEKLVITKSIDPRREYKNNAEHVRAWKLMGAPATAEAVSYVYVKTRERVYPVKDAVELSRLRGQLRIDYERYWRKAMAAVKRLLDPIRARQHKSLV